MALISFVGLILLLGKLIDKQHWSNFLVCLPSNKSTANLALVPIYKPANLRWPNLNPSSPASYFKVHLFLVKATQTEGKIHYALPLCAQNGSDLTFLLVAG